MLHERHRGLRPGGTGLGLALVHSLVRRLGGSVVASRAPEGGLANHDPAAAGGWCTVSARRPVQRCRVVTDRTIHPVTLDVGRAGRSRRAARSALRTLPTGQRVNLPVVAHSTGWGSGRKVAHSPELVKAGNMNHRGFVGWGCARRAHAGDRYPGSGPQSSDQRPAGVGRRTWLSAGSS